MKIISYSLFGYSGNEDHFDFDTYLRGLMINIRIARLLYPDWIVRVHIDISTYKGFRDLFDKLHGIIQIEICSDAPLTKAMLWRMKPIFDPKVRRVICRDLDSPLTYREAQAVREWEQSPKAAHAITDSISHNIPMLGGMVGFLSEGFKEKTGFNTWDDMVNSCGGYDKKGADQDFLNQKINPNFANSENSSIIQHYFLGYQPKHISDGYKTCSCRQIDAVTQHNKGCPLDIPMSLPEEYKETNNFCGHIGAAGWYEPVVFKFFAKHLDKFKDIRKAEECLRPDVFNWKI